METVQRELTEWESLVGLSFNPSWDKDVQKIKELNAELIDLLYRVINETDIKWSNIRWEDATKNKILDTAITKIMDAQMWAVKWVTFK